MPSVTDQHIDKLKQAGLWPQLTDSRDEVRKHRDRLREAWRQYRRHVQVYTKYVADVREHGDLFATGPLPD